MIRIFFWQFPLPFLLPNTYNDCWWSKTANRAKNLLIRESITMAFPEDKEPAHTEKATIGFRLRAFTEQVLGVWVEGRVVAVRKGHVRIDFGGYKERRPLNYGFFYPRGHALAGQSFTFKK
jgi:hypothetical protein